MKICVASGKGGTGKTLVSVALAETASVPVRLVDCDVEMPNSNLFLHLDLAERQEVELAVPEVNGELCTGCGACVRSCRFNALAMAGGRPMLFAELCHGCGACGNACQEGAIEEIPRSVGHVGWARRGELLFVEGRLTVGERSATPVIHAALARGEGEKELTLIDGPPGTACPFVAAVKDADLVLLVTEATPFGLHDLEIAVATLRAMGRPHAVVSNRSDLGDGCIRSFCRREGIDLLLELPHDRRVAEASARGQGALEAVPAWRALFEGLHVALERQVSARA